MRGALNGKVRGAFTFSATQRGGQELTLFAIITDLMHFGMSVVGLTSHQGQITGTENNGGAPSRTTTIAATDGRVSRRKTSWPGHASRGNSSPRQRRNSSADARFQSHPPGARPSVAGRHERAGEGISSRGRIRNEPTAENRF